MYSHGKEKIPIVLNLQTKLFRKDLLEIDKQKGEECNPRHQTPQGQSVSKPGTSLQNILVGM